MTLSKIKDGEEFKRSQRSKVTYTRIKKVKEGIVYSSNSSDRSFIGKGKLKVFPV